MSRQKQELVTGIVKSANDFFGNSIRNETSSFIKEICREKTGFTWLYLQGPNDCPAALCYRRGREETFSLTGCPRLSDDMAEWVFEAREKFFGSGFIFEMRLTKNLETTITELNALFRLPSSISTPA